MKLITLIIGVSLLCFSCQLANTVPPQQNVKAPDLPRPQDSGSNDRPDTLSYGTASRVQKGVTTQADLIEMFGGPSVMTTDRDGTEVWMYDKTTSSVSGNYANSTSRNTRSEAAAMGAFFGFPAFGGIGALGGGAGVSNSQSAQVGQGTQNIERRVRTITFIVKFNSNKTVKDYSIRQASY